MSSKEKEIRNLISKKITVKVIKRVILLVLACIFIYITVIKRFGAKYFFNFLGDLGTPLALLVLVWVLAVIFGIPQLLSDRNYEGEVTKIKYNYTVRGAKAGFLRTGGEFAYTDAPGEKCVDVIAWIKLDNGKEIKRVFRRYDQGAPNADILTVGQRVRHIKGSTFSQSFGDGNRHDVDCVMCGHYNKKEQEHCEKCGAPLLYWGTEKNNDE